MALLLLAACAPSASPQAVAPAHAEVRTFYYGDEEGLRVLTVALELAQPIPDAGTLLLGAALDDIELVPVDALTSASIRAEDGEALLDERRVEVTAGYRGELGSRAAPMTLQGSGRVSAEPDYLSLSGQAAWSASLFQQNTTVSVALGYGHDRVDPNRRLHPDDVDRWPDANNRVSLGAGVVQLATPRLALSGGAAYGWESGALASPYRRAMVWSGLGLFGDYRPEAERHPGERGRVTCYLGAAWYLGSDVALHPRLGGYFDTWGVEALVPELVIVAEPFSSLLIAAAYRYYLQGRASFYETRYRHFDPVRSGDRRLGAVEEHAARMELRWTFLGEAGQPFSLDLLAGYQLSLMSYDDLGLGPLEAHMGSLGVGATY